MSQKYDPNELTAALADHLDALAHLREMASGYRAQLVQDGWSDAMAENVAANLLIDMNRSAIA